MASLVNNNNKNKALGGLRVKNIDEIDRKFICGHCDLVVFGVWQLLCCGVLMCKWCLLQGLSNNEPFICPFCRVKQAKKEGAADRGVERDLKTITIVCNSCAWTGTYKDYLEHLQEKHADFECFDCHKRFFAINGLEEHREELCIERSILCGLPNCSSPIKHYHMKSHYLCPAHQRQLTRITSECFRRRGRQMRNQVNLQEYTDILESIKIVFSTYDILLNDYTLSKSDINQVKTIIEQMILRINELRKQDQDNDKRLKELTEQFNAIQIVVDNSKRTRGESAILILDENSMTILRFNLPTTASFSMNSSKFKTSQYGHIFMIRLCSTTEHNEEFLSIFLSLYNGEYYNLIPFPFSYDIHFILWDQSNQNKHIVYISKADPNSSAFVRPINEKNDEYGITKFCPLRYLSDPESIYVREGVFFIRIFIDFLKTGKNPFQDP